MEIREIVKDSLSYPLTNWKSYLILGVISVIINLYSYIWLFSPDTELSTIVMTSYILMIAEFLTGFLTVGYLIKIIKATLDCKNALPEFNGWLNIIVDGFKGSLVILVYTILFSILEFLILIFMMSQGYTSRDAVGLMELINPLFIIVIVPIALSIANMAFNEGKLSSAFKFGEIRDDIREIGLTNIIVLYLLFGAIYIIFRVISIALGYLLGWIDPFLLNLDSEMAVLVSIIKNLVLIPYLYIFATRTFALIYRSSVV